MTLSTSKLQKAEREQQTEKSKLQKAEKAAKSKKRELQKAKKGGHTNVCPQHFSLIIAP